MLSTSTFLPRSRSCGSKKNKGFTLIELLVVVSIMLIITSTLLLRQQKFDSATLMRTLSYSVALSVRQAQVYGTSVVGTTTVSGGTPTYAAGYGIFFNANTDRYRLFADINNNGKYTSNEIQQTFMLGSGYTISNFCAVVNTNTYYCKTGGTDSISSLAILFKRPNPDAQFTEIPDQPGAAISSAYIQLQGPGGDTRAVKVTTTGQISVCGANKTIPDC